MGHKLNAHSIDNIRTAWTDLRTPVSSIRLPGASAPTPTSYKGGQVLAFPNNTDTTVYFVFQMDHSYKLESDVEFHIHYALETAGSGGGAENVKWNFTYTWMTIGSAIDDPTTETNTTDVQSLNADYHYLDEIVASIDGSAIDDVSSVMICSLERDTSVADNYAHDVYLLSLDLHYQRDSLGSRQEDIK